MSEWIIQSCTTQGCQVAIRVRAGQQEAVPICKWCLGNTAYINDYQDYPRKLASLRRT